MCIGCCYDYTYLGTYFLQLNTVLYILRCSTVNRVKGLRGQRASTATQTSGTNQSGPGMPMFPVDLIVSVNVHYQLDNIQVTFTSVCMHALCGRGGSVWGLNGIFVDWFLCN